jgi:hypothetical protein
MAVETTYSKGRDIALISANELAGILETAHLLRSPANARRLLKTLRRADAHQTASSTIEQPRRTSALKQNDRQAVFPPNSEKT